MLPVPKNKLQEQYEFEKNQLEKYGFISSITFEEWLVIKGYKKNNKRKEGEK